MAVAGTSLNPKAYLLRSMREKVRKLSISRLSRRFSCAMSWRYSRAVCSWSGWEFNSVSTSRRIEDRGVFSSCVTLATRSFRSWVRAICRRTRRNASAASTITVANTSTPIQT